LLNPYPCANTAAEKAAEARTFSEGYYTPERFRFWAERPYRRYTLRHLVRAIEALGRAEYPLRVFEPACGCGVNLTNLAYYFPHFLPAGIDLSPEGVRTAQAEAKGFYMCGDAENVPYNDCAFDVVLCVSTVHHFHDPRRFLFECVRVLAPGGLLYLFEPDGAGFVLPADMRELCTEVEAKIRVLNPPGPATAKCATPRAATEVRFDRERTLTVLAHHGLRLLTDGHSEYLSEKYASVVKGFELAASFDWQVGTGVKYWAVLEREGIWEPR
jgi:SAM-dependent methyltransferase